VEACSSDVGVPIAVRDVVGLDVAVDRGARATELGANERRAGAALACVVGELALEHLHAALGTATQRALCSSTTEPHALFLGEAEPLIGRS
jgi:hypothetical protein